MSNTFLMEVIVTVLFLMGMYGYYRVVEAPKVPSEVEQVVVTEEPVLTKGSKEDTEVFRKYLLGDQEYPSSTTKLTKE